MPLWLPVVFCLVLTVFATASVVHQLQLRHALEAHGVRAQATVTRLHHDSDSRLTSVDVSFPVGNGSASARLDNDYLTLNSLHRGDRLAVLFDPADPSKVLPFGARRVSYFHLVMVLLLVLSLDLGCFLAWRQGAFTSRRRPGGLSAPGAAAGHH